MNLLTSTRLSAARRCQRYHKLRFIDGLRPVRDAATLRFGSLVHMGLEAWWKAPPDERLDAALAATEGESDPFDLARAQELLRGYHYRWADERYEVLAVEKEFRAPLINPATGYASTTWELGGKIDAIVRDPATGQVLLVEHKTSSQSIELGSDYWKRLRIDSQLTTYFTGAKALGFDVAGVLYDVLGKPALRPLKQNNRNPRDEAPDEFRMRLIKAIAEDPARYYQRGLVMRLESEMLDGLYDTWQLAQQIREAERAGRAPKNSDACFNYSRACDFFPICSGEASPDDGRLYQIGNVNPELSEVAVAAEDS